MDAVKQKAQIEAKAKARVESRERRIARRRKYSHIIAAKEYRAKSDKSKTPS